MPSGLALLGVVRFRELEDEAIRADGHRNIGWQRIEPEAAVPGPYAILAVQIDDDVASAFVTNFGMGPRDAFGLVLEDKLILRRPADAHWTFGELHPPQELVAAVHRESRHVTAPCGADRARVRRPH
jgi:hypothetical protein